MRMSGQVIPLITPLVIEVTGRRARWSRKWSASNTTMGVAEEAGMSEATAATLPIPASIQPSRATTSTGLFSWAARTTS